jgi:hypothetical protein
MHAVLASSIVERQTCRKETASRPRKRAISVFFCYSTSYKKRIGPLDLLELSKYRVARNSSMAAAIAQLGYQKIALAAGLEYTPIMAPAGTELNFGGGTTVAIVVV